MMQSERATDCEQRKTEGSGEGRKKVKHVWIGHVEQADEEIETIDMIMSPVHECECLVVCFFQVKVVK